jgi:hypothetical protein
VQFDVAGPRCGGHAGFGQHECAEDVAPAVPAQATIGLNNRAAMLRMANVILILAAGRIRLPFIIARVEPKFTAAQVV